MIRQILNKLFGNKKPIDQTQSASSSQSIYELAEDNSDIISGYQLCVTMNDNVPLKYLLRHGEVVETIPASEIQGHNPYYIWLPKVDPNLGLDFLDEGATMSSAVGSIPQDGGSFLPFLIEVRKIIEAPRDSMLSDFSDAERKARRILSLKDSDNIKDASKYIDLLYGSSFDKIFIRVLENVSTHTFDGLTLDHMKILYENNYQSVQAMISAPDNVLLSLKGIGPARLRRIRANI